MKFPNECCSTRGECSCYVDGDDLLCIHEEYEADVNGRATCNSCGIVWYLTAQDIQHERELHAAYNAMMRREEWRQWREDWVRRLAFWRRWRKPDPIVDDVPF